MPDNSGSNRLTDKQENYVLELIKGKSQREAYRTAYPTSKKWKDSTVDCEASKLLNNTKVIQRFNKLQEDIRKPKEDSAIATAKEVLEELSSIGLGKKTFTSFDMFGNERERKPTVNERLKALEQLGKHHKLFTERIDLNHQGAVQIVDDIE